MSKKVLMNFVINGVIGVGFCRKDIKYWLFNGLIIIGSCGNFFFFRLRIDFIKVNFVCF